MLYPCMWLSPPSVGTGGDILKTFELHTSMQSDPDHQAAPYPTSNSNSRPAVSYADLALAELAYQSSVCLQVIPRTTWQSHLKKSMTGAAFERFICGSTQCVT